MILKLFNLMWPFITEMVLGKTTFLEALVTNRKKIIFICLIFSSVGLNYVTIERLFSLSSRYILLERKHTALNIKFSELKVETNSSSFIIVDFLKIEKNRRNKCYKFTLPKFTAKPKLPIDELSKLPANDLASIISIEKLHIMALHEYIDNSMGLLIREHGLYLTSCIGYDD